MEQYAGLDVSLKVVSIYVSDAAGGVVANDAAVVGAALSRWANMGREI